MPKYPDIKKNIFTDTITNEFINDSTILVSEKQYSPILKVLFKSNPDTIYTMMNYNIKHY